MTTRPSSPNATGADAAYAATFNGEQDVYYRPRLPRLQRQRRLRCHRRRRRHERRLQRQPRPRRVSDEPRCVGAGAVPDGSEGPPLTVAKTPSGDASSCPGAPPAAAADTDYADLRGLARRVHQSRPAHVLDVGPDVEEARARGRRPLLPRRADARGPRRIVRSHERGSGARGGDTRLPPADDRRLLALIDYCCVPSGNRMKRPLTKQIWSLKVDVVPAPQALPVASFPCE